ncbi:hypothetical protein OsI_33408 [Oryza sativa Indica Group]|uniref:Aminotransferase-like plant mobile domain-containing protein n=1 Tax=Oryza sativa subsp. indica TaxID=39946 RepID=B8BGL7_ORYSI|nr:hypothetical protein OsI_33408 [Oryza sativa Indica Group]
MAPMHKSRLGKAPIVIDSDDSDDDDQEHDSTKFDDFILGMQRKLIVQDVMKELMSKSYVLPKPHVKKQKAHANAESSFTRFSIRYFSDVISKSSDYHKSIIHKYEFDFLLLFESNSVPVKFASWIVKHVDVRTSEIILNDKIIPVTVESVHAVLGVPLSGIEFSKDYEAGRQYVMYMFGQDAIPSVKFFGDLLIQKKDLSEDQIITSFLTVALACFLCPNSSLIPSVKYLTIFEDANLLKSYDWSKFVYEWLMTYAKKFQKNNTIGGCLFYWAALYLDNVDFGSRYIDQGLPRISVWKDDMISVFSDLDKIDDNTFGLRPLKDFRATCYFQPKPTHSRSNAIRAKLDSAIGSMIPDCLKEKISELLSSHFCSHHVLDSEPCEDILISILALLAESSQFHPLEVPTTHISPQINTEAGPSNREPTSPKARQSDFCVLNDDGVRSPAKHTSLSNVELYEKSVSRSTGKGCTSIDRIADLYGSIANCDDDSMLLNKLSAHPKAVVTPCGNANASSSHEDEPLLTPDVAYLRTRNNILNETNEGPSFAALSLVKNVANKFRSRITHFNSRTPFLGEEMPSFKLLDSDDDISDCDKENEVAEAITPACSQNSPEVQFLGESKFNDRCKKMCTKTDELYNASNNLSTSNQRFSSTGCKLPLYGPRRVLVPARHAIDPFVIDRPRFTVTDEENRYFIALCQLAESSKWQSY